jgi:5-methylcytosine-specific restriction endonuclease McrA
VRAVSDRRRRRDAVYPARRLQVFERAEGMCEHCRAAGCEQVHHIAGRGGVDPHRLSNLVGLCAGCHARAHGEPEWARQVGLMRSRTARMG